MDRLERSILAAFDSPAATGTLSSRVLPVTALEDSAEVKETIAKLIEQGFVRLADRPGACVRTEDGRLQLASLRDITIYSRPGCHLCEEAKAQIAPLLKEFSARLTEIDIDADPDLRARYDYDVPVIFLGARKAAKHRVDVAQFRRQLRDATAG
jgi:glutaredoxin